MLLDSGVSVAIRRLVRDPGVGRQAHRGAHQREAEGLCGQELGAVLVWDRMPIGKTAVERHVRVSPSRDLGLRVD